MSATEPIQLGDFTVIEKIGQGAMGAVYKAHQASLARIVALKLLPAHFAGDADFLARFKREAMAAASLNHPSIVQVYAAGQDDGSHYFAMEYVEGESLGDRLERKGRIDPREAIAIAHYVAQALDYAWKKTGVIHRDIKPDNIFLSREGTVKLGDLGLAKMLGDQGAGLTQTGVTMGTPYYVSPEQALSEKEIDFRADIYSLGCTIYHAMTGLPPYRGESGMAVMLQHISKPAPKIQAVWPECPLPLIGLLDRMLRKKPEERHESYEALLQQLSWVAERLDQSPAAAASMSMIVPMPVPQAGSTVGGSRKAPTAPRGVVAKLPPPSGGAGKTLAILGTLAATATGLFLLQPWKKLATPVTESAAPVAKPVLESVAPVSKPVAESLATVVKPTAEKAAPSTPNPAVPSSISADGPGFVSLLDSDQLSAWKQLGLGGFIFEEGIATSWVNGGQGGYWWYSKKTFSDFTLKLEFRIQTPGANSGVAVRFPTPDRGKNYPDQRGYQIDVSEEANPLEKTGAICFVKAPSSEPQKARDWNELEIEVVGQRYLMRVNGTLVNDFTGSRLSSGYIGLQNCKIGGVQYRNIRIKELDSPAASPFGLSNKPAAVATKDTPFENSLGMRFVPVPITGGPTSGQRMLFSVWETRVQDYEIFAKETGIGARKPNFPQGPTHPVTMVTWEDAQAFCRWLTARERKDGRLSSTESYRLPTDHEWSCAVGIGDREDPLLKPVDKSTGISGVFPWGNAWPPPPAAGNLAGGEIPTAQAAGNNVFVKVVIAGYRDDFVETAPVGTFTANRFGLHDVAGNVSEWCEDWLNGQQTDRVYRGGGWIDFEPGSLLSARRRPLAGSRLQYGASLGFRCVIETPRSNGANPSGQPQ